MYTIQATEEKLFANTTSRLVNRESLPIQITESRTITSSTVPEVGTSPVSQRATVEPASQQKVDLSILAKENVSEVESIKVASEEPGLRGSLFPYPKVFRCLLVYLKLHVVFVSTMSSLIMCLSSS